MNERVLPPATRRACAALAFLLLGGLCVLLTPAVTPASATPTAPRCPTPTVPASAKAARAVFSGSVTAATRSGTGIVHDVAVDRVYRGAIDTETVQVQTVPARRCALGRLADGQAYVFFVGGGGEPWVAANDGGTSPATPELVQRVEGLLGEGRPPVPPAPEEAVFTPVADGEPRRFTRVAAPGLAMILVGLLGLVVVRGLGRRG